MDVCGRGRSTSPPLHLPFWGHMLPRVVFAMREGDDRTPIQICNDVDDGNDKKSPRKYRWYWRPLRLLSPLRRFSHETHRRRRTFDLLNRNSSFSTGTSASLSRSGKESPATAQPREWGLSSMTRTTMSTSTARFFNGCLFFSSRPSVVSNLVVNRLPTKFGAHLNAVLADLHF